MRASRNFDLLLEYAAQCPERSMLAGKKNGQWIEYSAKTCLEIINHLSYGLLHLGFEAGDRAAIISFNRPEWNWADYAVSQLGGISVPMYPTASADDQAYILNDAQVKVLFIEKDEFIQKWLSIKDQVPSIQHVVTFEAHAEGKILSELISIGKENPDPKTLESRRSNIRSKDLMTLIYTSGTTGRPKGVMLSHQNILSNVNTCTDLFPMFQDKKVLSFLPLCHIFERMVGYLYVSLRASIYYAESMETIGENLKEVHPYAFTTVPRLLEKVYDKIVAAGRAKPQPIRAIFFWALKLGHAYELHGKNGAWYSFKLKIADALVFKKWRAALGGEAEVIVTGAAALQPRLARVFTAAGISVLEGYGLTETSPVITVNQMPHSGRMFGSVGPVIDGVQVKIADDGEILCKGPNVMMGYYNKPEATAEVMDAEGWFHTGDIGEFREGKFLAITDRKKEVFKTSGGKYIAPQPMENAFKESTFIEQIMVVGPDRNFPSAIISPAWEQVEAWLRHKNLPLRPHEELINDELVRAKFEREIQSINKRFGQWEQVKKFSLVAQPFSIEGGELTPTLKLRRKAVYEKYAQLVESMYSKS